MYKAIKFTKCDVKNVYDVTMNLYIYPSILIAHRIGIFEYIANKNKTLNEICEDLNLHKRPAQALFAVLISVNLLCFRNKKYSLPAESKEFLLKASPNYFGCFWDMMYDNKEIFSLENIEYAIRNNHSIVYDREKMFDVHIVDKEKVKKFTNSMHSVSMSSASVWPSLVRMENHQHILDVGGGSGAHSIGLVAKWQHLKCTVFDLHDVCAIAKKFIEEYGYSEKINIKGGNIWTDIFPHADVHLYSNVLHDWADEKVQFLINKSYSSLPSGGIIIIHEILYNDDFSGPLSAAASSLVMLSWTEGKQYSGEELSMTLSKAGFENIKIIPAYGYHSIITAQKK